MEAQLTYRYNHLDKQHEFGLVFTFEGYDYLAYINWVWFYMGAKMTEVKADFDEKTNMFLIYPYSLKDFTNTKVIGNYKYSNDSEKLAKLITNKIIKTLLKNKK